MAALAFLQHYFEYLGSPPVLLAILVVVGPIYLEIFKNKKLAALPRASKIPGCFRLGLSKRSNLDDQYNCNKRQGSETKKAQIKALFTYPVKSCRGVELAASEAGSTGLKYDRLFTFAQLVSTPDKSSAAPISEGVERVSEDWKHQWLFITQREFPRLALIETELWVPNPKANRRAGAASLATCDGDVSIKGRRGRKKDEDDSVRSESASTLGAPPLSEKQLKDTWVENGGCLILRFPFEPDFNLFGLRTETVTIRLPLAPTEQRFAEKSYKIESLSIWKDSPQAVNITGEIPSDDLAKLKYFLGVSNTLGLFRVDPNNRRAVTRSLPKDRPNESYSVGFADAFPFHLLNLASVQAQHAQLPSKNALKGSLDARRFRANVYVSGPPAYDEDSWKRLTIGRCIRPRNDVYLNGSTDNARSQTLDDGQMVETDGEYHVACRTARCKLPNVDQDTGIKDANEPLTTLTRTRKVDKGAYPHPCLGMQMIPLFQQGILRVGDKVHVLERGEHVYEKMFA